MDYEEALKIASSSVVGDSYLTITIGNNLHLLLPYSDGMLFLNSLKNVEKFDSIYYPAEILPINRDDIRSSIMSREEYLQYKTAALLGMPVDTYKAELEKRKKPNE